jgi:hypothetical protein
MSILKLQFWKRFESGVRNGRRVCCIRIRTHSMEGESTTFSVVVPLTKYCCVCSCPFFKHEKPKCSICREYLCIDCSKHCRLCDKYVCPSSVCFKEEKKYCTLCWNLYTPDGRREWLQTTIDDAIEFYSKKAKEAGPQYPKSEDQLALWTSLKGDTTARKMYENIDYPPNLIRTSTGQVLIINKKPTDSVWRLVCMRANK